MRLTKLELQGFKSFAKKTELQFGSGITAVIGPNGSGKSNLADAVRWVLGEQSAKALRGARMEDVIFNGTQSRRAQAFCEVALTFDNSDHKLPLDYGEITVSRRVYRTGGSEYSINGTACRLMDVLDLFRDTGIGKDGYSIIGQGKVDEILSNKSMDRRTALEEAAGVMRFRVRKEEAERKLDATQKNMERIYDILGELQARIDPLREQSDRAKSYLKLRDELKELEVSMLLYQTDKNRERGSALAALKTALDTELADASAMDEELKTQCLSNEERIRTLDEALSKRQNVLMELLAGAEKSAGECKLLIANAEQGEAEHARLAAERETATAKLALLHSSLIEQGEGKNDAAAVAALQQQIREAEAALGAADEALKGEEGELDEKKERIMAQLNRLSDAKSDLSRCEAMLNALDARAAELRTELAEAETEQEDLAEEAERAATQRTAEEAERTACRERLSKAEQERLRLEGECAARGSEQRLLEQNLGALSSRAHVLAEMKRSREGYQNSVRLLLRDAETDGELNSRILGVVAELIRVPAEYETAVSMALGGSLQNLVTRNAEDAKAVIEQLRRREYGRATVLPLSLLSVRPLDAAERRYLGEKGCIGVASELIDCDKSVKKAIDYLLGRTVIVTDLNSGIALKQQSRGTFHIVTLKGDYISTGGTMTGGSVQSRSFSLLSRERELGELNEQIKAQKAACAEKASVIEQLKVDVERCENSITACRTALHESELALAKQFEQCRIIERDIQRSAQHRDELTTALSDTAEDRADVEARIQASRQLSESIEQGDAVSREDVARAQQALNAHRTERETLAQSLQTLRVEEAALTRETEARERERRRLERESAETKERLGSIEAGSADCLIKIRSAKARIAEMEQAQTDKQDVIAEARTELKRLEDERTAENELLSHRRDEREQLHQKSAELEDKRHKTELAADRLEMEQKQSLDALFERYELTYENALPLKRELPIGSTNVRIAELKSGVRALGDVNLSAIEDFAAVSTRYEELSKQYADLLKAKEDLTELIEKLTDAMRRVFTTEFAKVQKNFSEVFEKLFGGGHAELLLADEKDVLNCDVDIIAQPPGKKLQLLSLLSGGERAMTAIALLFALLELKAPAFCVLDEIETSLDEANVERFAAYLKAYSADTQFILITHRKGSMEVCDTLYGVAMEEKGVSSIVSAKFEEAS